MEESKRDDNGFYRQPEGKKRMIKRQKWGYGIVVAAMTLLLAACAGQMDESAGSGAVAIEAASYSLDVKAERFESPPEGTRVDPLPLTSSIYIESAETEADVSLDFSLNRKGDFTLAEGKGVLTIKGRSVPFALDQVSVVHREKLSDGTEFVFGGLQANAAAGIEPSTFAFGFRFIPQTQELELRLSNGEGLVVFGHGDTIAQHEQEIDDIEARNRPQNT